MKRWIRFFVGTPARFLLTLLALVAGAWFVNRYPGELQAGLTRLLSELYPLIEVILVLLIVLGGLRIIVYGRGGRKK